MSGWFAAMMVFALLFVLSCLFEWNEERKSNARPYQQGSLAPGTGGCLPILFFVLTFACGLAAGTP